MPPKKKPDKKEPEEEPTGYNIGVLNLDQLKRYAKLLQSEIEDMRNHCNFYQKMEDELVGLLRITEDDLKHNENCILSKDIELEKLKLDFQKHLQEKRQWPTYMEHCSVTKQQKMSNATGNNLEDEKERHEEVTNQLQKVLQEKDRQLEALRVKIEMARKEEQEKNEIDLKNMDDHQRSLLEQSIEKFNTMMKEAEEDFKQAKKVMECEAHEEKIMRQRTFHEACDTFKGKLHDYYKEVTRQDLDTVKQLKRDIRKVEESIKNSKPLLEKAYAENKELKSKADNRNKKRSSYKSAALFDAGPLKMLEALKMHNKTEQLALANQDLEEQIKNVTEQICDLRKQFTLSLKMVRENAEKKAVLLEQKLHSITGGNRDGSAMTSEEYKSSQQTLPWFDTTDGSENQTESST